jgi:nitroreductase
MAVSNGFIPLDFNRISPKEQAERLENYIRRMETRRSVRAFSNRPVSQKVMEKVIQAAGTAPSGANQQPWTYVLIKDPTVKKSIREAAEQEEKELLKKSKLDTEGKASMFGDKQYLEDAPYLVALFRVNYGLVKEADGSERRINHYYVPESVPISAGFFQAALKHVGLDSLVHAPVAATQEILNRPRNEKPALLFAVGFAEEGYKAPELKRKPLSEIAIGKSVVDSKPYPAPQLEGSLPLDDQVQLSIAEDYYQMIKKRRNVRDFSTEDADIELIYQAIRAAATTPSGGNLQPYRFVIVSDAERKQKIRELAEIEERKLYEERISDEWRDALAPLGTDASKPHLSDAPHLIICFKVNEEIDQASVLDQSLLYKKNNFALESGGMAVGILMGALHRAGLCTLTHTPSPMVFLRDYLERPLNEMPFLVMPVGYPAEGCLVPNITKKPLSEILITC